MKTYLKYTYLAVAAAMALGMTACNNDDDYVPATAEQGQQVYFSSEAPTVINASPVSNTVSIPVCRVVTTDAVTIPISVDNKDGLFEVPSSITFNAGQAKTDLVLNYDLDKVGFDNYSTITVSIADEQNKTVYGSSEFTFKVGIPAPWTSLGMATFTEGFWSGGTFKVELQQNDIDPQTYRLVKPFAQDKNNYDNYAAEYFEFRIYKAGETLYDVTLTQDIVWYNNTPIFNHPSYDDVINIVFPGRFGKYPNEADWAHNTVITYKEDGTPGIVQMAPFYYMFNTGGWDQSQKDGIITIAFPGFEVSDFSLGVSYEGMLTKGSDQYVLAEVNLGEDITSAKVLVASEAELEILEEDDIINDNVESVKITKSGSLQLPFSYTDGGKYYIIAMGFDAEDNEVALELAEFKVQAATGETWTKVGTGTFTYKGLFDEDQLDPGLEIFRSNANSTRYKITHWLYDVDFCFTLSVSGTVLLVDEQETGYVMDGYGMVYVNDCQDYYGADNEYGISRFDSENGTFYFANTYYIPNVGGFAFTGHETFVLDADATENVRQRQARARYDITADFNRISTSHFHFNHDLVKAELVK